MGTYVDGIGASQNIDSSGEIVDIAGLDISSLEVDGSLNWEHKKDVPDQLVGKVLKARKIFSKKDCEDDRQLYFWEKCQVPYLYILGELFDDYTDSARTVAGLFRYDLDHRGKNTKDIVGFSVEGATISKQGNTIVRSIARKITCTSLPCNKQAVAEMVPATGKKPKDNLDNIFKTESYVDIEVVNLPSQTNIWDLLKKESLFKKVKSLFVKKDEVAMSYGSSTGLTGAGPTSPSLSCSEPDMAKASAPVLAPVASHGAKIGRTVSGKDIHSHARVGSYTGFSVQDHHDASNIHRKMAEGTKDPKTGQHHWDKSKLHTGAANTMSDRARKLAPKPVAPSRTAPTGFHDSALNGRVNYRKSEVTSFDRSPDHVKMTQKAQRARRAQQAPNNDKQHWDQHKINHSESNSQNVKREIVPNKQVLHPVPQTGQPKNNMLHNNLLAPKESLHKSVTSSFGVRASSTGVSVSDKVSVSDTAPPKPKKMPLGKITKSMIAGSGLASPDRLEGMSALSKENLKKCDCGMAKCASCGPKLMAKGGAYSGNVPKDKKIKEIQQAVDAGQYKPDSKKTAEAMFKHPSKPLKKSTAYARAEHDYANWEKREEFENYMKSRMPHMTKGEIMAFGQAMLLNKSMKLEKSLNGLVGLLKEDKK